MKKIFLLFGAMALACTLHAKTVTLDPAHPLNPEVLEFDENGTWVGTYSEDYPTIDFNAMSFMHGAWEEYDFWYGFTIGSSADTTYEALKDQFRCVAGGGLAGKGTPFIQAYAMDGMGPVCQVIFSDGYPWTAEEVYLCNGSWTLDNILKGGGAARPFAAGDSLVVIIQGLNDSFEAIEDKQVTFFLADYRSDNEADWTVNRGWEKCDLSSLGEVYGLQFTMVTSDKGDWGANTAMYFGLDGLKITRPGNKADFENEAGGINLTAEESNWFGADEPDEENEWHTWKSGDFTFMSYYTEYYKSAWTVTNETSTEFNGYNDAYRSASGGAYEGTNFAVWNQCYYGADTVKFDKQVVDGFFVNNNSYAVSSMCNGDGFAKKFGRSDWFKLTVTGLNGTEAGNSVDFYLAKDGEYVKDWTYVDLSELGEIDGVIFSMSSSDTGDWGMNTPAYFAMDAFGIAMPENYVEPARAKFTLDITIASSELTLVDAIADEGWWQLMAENEEYTIWICTPEDGATQVAGTYSVDDLDADYSGLVINETQEDILFESGSITVSIDEQTGDISFVGTIVGSDGFTYNINITYVRPTAQQTVEVSIDDAVLDDTFADWDLYTVYGTDANGVTVTLSFYTAEGAEDITGEYTENDLESMYAETSITVGETTTSVYSGTFTIAAGEGEGEYIITAELLCSNNTLYQVTMVVPGVISAIDNNTIATKAVKVVRDGQVLIIRDGKAVNMSGVKL